MKRSIALLSCCAPCSFAIISDMHSRGENFCVLFFNPNIFPAAEYQKRLAEQIKLCESLGIRCITSDYDHGGWLSAVRGLENEPERGKRCLECFKYRFTMAAKWARANGYTAIASTFGVSKHKSQSQVDAAASSTLPPDIIYTNVIPQPSGGIPTEFYRQSYCGCEFSATFPIRKEH